MLSGSFFVTNKAGAHISLLRCGFASTWAGLSHPRLKGETWGTRIQEGMMRFGSIVTISTLALMGCSAAPTHATRVPDQAALKSELKTATVTKDCSAGEVQLSFDGRDGEYTGMSHDGALMVLRNTSSRTCSVPKRPQLTFTDAAGKTVPLQVNIPRGMHPGPVLVPVTLAPGASAQSTLRWVVGPVYDKNTCVDAAQAAITLPGGKASTDLKMHVCGQTGSPIEFEEEWLQLSSEAKTQE